jgi:hypothetical protein
MIFLYKHGEKPHGIEELSQFLSTKKAFVPKICTEFVDAYRHQGGDILGT